MYGKKKSPTEKRSCYKMTPKSPLAKMFKNKKAGSNKPCPGCSTICPSCRSGKSPTRNYKKGYYGA